MRKNTIIALSAILAMAAWGCDDGDDDTDAGRDGGRRVDANTGDPDTGPDDPDSGPDAGPPDTFTARVANNVPGIAALHICLTDSVNVALPEPPLAILLTGGGMEVPFRGVSDYLALPFFQVIDGVDFIVGLYDASTFVGVECPSANPLTDPTAIAAGMISSDALTANGTYSIIVSGIAPGTLGAAAGEMPTVCNPPAFNTACTEEANGTRVVLTDDDLADPAADMAKLRVSNQLANIPPAPFDLCYDPSLIPMEVMPRLCTDTNPLDEEDALFTAVTYGAVTEYVERDPIQPTITSGPGTGLGGAFYIVIGGDGSCPAYNPAMHGTCLPVVAAFPAAPPSPNIQPNLEAGDVTTIFVSGVFARMDENAAASFMWQDNFTE